MKLRQTSLIAGGVLAAAIAAAPAHATFPGANGSIAFDSDRDAPGEQLDIFTMRPNGSHPVNLTNNWAMDQQPNWSPDGRKIAFASDRDGDFEIFVMNARRLAPGAGNAQRHARFRSGLVRGRQAPRVRGGA